MFRSKQLIGSKGSLVLSLVASGAVAVTIVATHQAVQRFASGAVGAFNQEQAYVLAQRALAVAGLMVHRNVILCSSEMEGNKALGCKWTQPPASDKVAAKLYNGLKISPSWMTVSAEGFSQRYAKNYVRLKAPAGKEHASIFKNAEVSWTLRSLRDTNLRSISAGFDKGYICRKAKTFEEIKGVCEDLSEQEKLLGNRDSRLLSDEDKECKNDQGSAITGSVCDYYLDSDGDDSVVFISVRVPYQETDAEGESSKNFTANAAVRRPISLVKIHVKQDASMCSIGCTAGKRTHMDNANAPSECAGLASGSQSGGEYFTDNIHTVNTSLTIKNYGPGALYGVRLFREDIDPNNGLLLGRSMESFSGDPLEPLHFAAADSNRNKRVKTMTHQTPCYASKFYKPNLETASCDCEPSNSSDSVNTAGGVVCKKSKSECAGSASADKKVFASNAPGVLQDTHTSSEARDSLSGCSHAPGKAEDMPALSNSILTAFEKPCKDAGDCQFNRIDEDQPSGANPKKTWCGNNYTGLASTNPTGRKLRPTAGPMAFPSAQETVSPASDHQRHPPLSTVSLP